MLMWKGLRPNKSLSGGNGTDDVVPWRNSGYSFCFKELRRSLVYAQRTKVILAHRQDFKIYEYRGMELPYSRRVLVFGH